MATTRTFDRLGIWALNANIVIPPSPITGDAYRNTATTQVTNEEGEPFDTAPDSAVFNQKLFIVSSFTDEINKRGIVGWSDVVDYTVPAIVFASDGFFYFCLADSGPATIVKDPAGGAFPGFWEIYVSGQIPLDDLTQFKVDLADETASTEGTRLVGHTGQTSFDAINARTTIASLAATTGATLVNTATTGMNVQTFAPAVMVRIDPNGIVARGTSYNVASLTHPISPGQYVVTLITPLSNTDFFAVVTSHDNDTATATTVAVIDAVNSTASAIFISTFSTSGSTSAGDPHEGLTLMVWDNP